MFKSLIAGALLATLAAGCAPDAPAAAPASGNDPEQMIVDRSAAALSAMRSNPDFRSMDDYLARAKGVMIFPRVIKAALIFGGEGGNGVLVAKRADGSWSAPAFYSLGAGSAGFQIGFQEATVVLFLMDDRTLSSAMNTGLKLGTDVSVAAGTIGDSGKSKSTTASRGIVELSSVGGVFAGVSLDGAVVGPRGTFNRAYYGPTANTYDIVMRGKFDRAGTSGLSRALSP